VASTAWADAEKDAALQNGTGQIGTVLTSCEAKIGGGGYRFTLTNGETRVPVIVVGGTPYQMGWHLGHLQKAEIQAFVPKAVEGFKAELGVTDEVMDRVWALNSAYTDKRFLQELAGVADGAGIPVRVLEYAHCLPLLDPYSCSAIAAWGSATPDGHLYQTRDLDWTLKAMAHEFPALVVYIPIQGFAHVIPTFAGVIGANCGMSASGLVLSEIGDSPAKEMPYNLQAPHFTSVFRALLYDSRNLSDALTAFQSYPRTKRYHFVFGDGKTEKRAVKIRAHSPETPPNDVKIWKDADATDELAPKILENCVYHDEGRGAFPTLKAEQGKLDGEALLALARKIPIKGDNVLDAVFDGTGLRVWVTYAGGDKEAYQRPAVYLDLTKLDGDHDGRPDLEEGSRPTGENGLPAFLDAAH
jgi:isopenicillin-N N-acyltransferase-like protein